MELPKDDQEFLNGKGYDWVLRTENNNSEGFLIIRNFSVCKGGFTPEATNLMIRIPPQYNMAQLDMWYCNPAIRIIDTGQYAKASEAKENHLGEEWQRFSRHLPSGVWKAGVDNLRTFMPLIWCELQGYKKQ